MSTDIVLPKYVTVAQQALAQPVEDGAILLDLQSELYFSLEGIAYRVWELFNEQTSVAAVVLQLLDEYAIDEQTLTEDLCDLLAEWQRAGLISAEY